MQTEGHSSVSHTVFCLPSDIFEKFPPKNFKINLLSILVRWAGLFQIRETPTFHPKVMANLVGPSKSSWHKPSTEPFVRMFSLLSVRDQSEMLKTFVCYICVFQLKFFNNYEFETFNQSLRRHPLTSRSLVLIENEMMENDLCVGIQKCQNKL